MRHIDLFSGIGGFALAVDTVWPNSQHIFCDNDPFCQQVLKKHWPNSKIYGDIRTLTNTTSNGQFNGSDNREERYILQTEIRQNKEDKQEWSGWFNRFSENNSILTGGFPCQPFSQAGRRQGTADDRYLWPEMFRVIREFKPTWVIAENVRGLVTWNEGMVLEQVCTDLESEGYEVQPLIIPAVAVNAPHRRDRVWFIAHRRQQYGEQGDEQGVEADTQEWATRTTNTERQNKDDASNSERKGHEGQEYQEGQSARHGRGAQFSWASDWRDVALATCDVRVDDGLSVELDGFKLSKAGHRNNRLKALGNAIVPQVAIEIMQAIKEANKLNK